MATGGWSGRPLCLFSNFSTELVHQVWTSLNHENDMPIPCATQSLTYSLMTVFALCSLRGNHECHHTLLPEYLAVLKEYPSRICRCLYSDAGSRFMSSVSLRAKAMPIFTAQEQVGRSHPERLAYAQASAIVSWRSFAPSQQRCG